MQRKSIDIYITTCPVPYKYKGEVHGGLVLREDKYCSGCQNRKCNDNLLTKYVKCPSGMLSNYFSKNGIELLLFGFSKKTEKYSRNSIDIEIVDHWLKGLSDIVEIEHEQEQMMWEPFHDITPCISLLFRNIESIIAKYPGATINEKIENQEDPIPYQIITLFKTTSLLDEQLKMIRYSASDWQISAGKKKPFPIYKVIDKLAKIFKVSANERNIDIDMDGDSFNAPFLFDSFSSVPFILLDNAIKYTPPGETIKIKVYDIDNGGVKFSVSSLSPICDEHIFEMRHRGSYSQQLTDRGMGMGLYVAKRICDANHATISHQDEAETEIIHDGITFCRNSFIVITC